MTAQEQLQEVNNAIQKILYTGQSYKIGSRSITRADLPALNAMRKELLSEINASGGSGFGRACALGVFDGR